MLWLPVLLPLIFVVATGLALILMGGKATGWLVIPYGFVGFVTFLLGLPMFLIWPQYLAFVVGCVMWMRKHGAEAFWQNRYRLPLIFAPVAGIGFILYSAFLADYGAFSKSSEKITLAAFIGFCAVPYAYLYVALAGGLTRYAEKKQWIAPVDAAH